MCMLTWPRLWEPSTGLETELGGLQGHSIMVSALSKLSSGGNPGQCLNLKV